jgi:hypothetical protein
MALDRNSAPQAEADEATELIPSFGEMARRVVRIPRPRGQVRDGSAASGATPSVYQQVVGSAHALWASIGVLVVVRLALLPWTPPGFFRDEAAIGAQTKALAATGADVYGHSWPLFFANLGDTSSGLYLYPAALWGSIFGTNETSLRYFSQFLTIAAIAVLACAVRLWMGTGFALLLAAVALAMPWNWLQGSLAWDDAMAPLWVALTFLAFSVLLRSVGGRAVRRAALLGLPLASAGCAYIYPPLRASAPLVLLLLVVLLRRREVISRSERNGIAVLAAVAVLPLAHFLLAQPGATSRTMSESVFHDASVWGGLVSTISNFWGLVNPAFLFLRGDPNLRHSTGEQGMLGIISLLPVLALLGWCIRRVADRPRGDRVPFDNDTLLIVVCASCAGFGLLGSALTATGQPHSLRATAAWPFFAILLAIGWRLFLQRVQPNRIAVLATVFALTTGAYAVDLATGYRHRSAEWFDVSVRDQIHKGLPVNQWDLTLKYYGKG